MYVVALERHFDSLKYEEKEMTEMKVNWHFMKRTMKTKIFCRERATRLSISTSIYAKKKNESLEKRKTRMYKPRYMQGRGFTPV